MRTFPFALPLLVLAAAPLAAQEPTPTAKDGAETRRARLSKALEKMAALPSVAFTSKETGGGIDVIRMGGAKPAPTEVTGKQADGLLHVTCAGDQELLLGGRRMLARGGDGEAWKLRAGKTSNGNPLPFVFDPQTFFTVVKGLKPDVARAEVGAWQDKPIEVFSVTLDGDAARDLLWGGLVPEASGFGSMVVMRVAGAAAGMPAMPPPTVTVDLAFFVDPASDLVQRVRLRVTDQNAGVLGGRVVFAAGGAGGIAIGGDEEEEEEEADADQKPKGTTWKDGLPVRKSKNRKGGGGDATSTLDVEFKDFEKATLPELDEAARAMLGRPANK